MEQKRRCPRCHKHRTEEWFPEPITLCVVCYAAIPENQGLNLDQLFLKAQRSRPPIRRHRELLRREAEEEFSPQLLRVRQRAREFLHNYARGMHSGSPDDLVSAHSAREILDRVANRTPIEDDTYICGGCQEPTKRTDMHTFIHVGHGREVTGCSTCFNAAREYYEREKSK